MESQDRASGCRLVCLAGFGALVLALVLSATAAGDGSPRITERPTIVGEALVGSTLSGTATWEPATGAAAYQWMRCDVDGEGCAAIAGAVGADYTVGTGDVGHRLLVRLTVRWDADTRSKNSEPTAVVPEPAPPSAPAPLSPPSILGTAVEGSTLTTDGGTWAADAPITLTYAWTRCGVAGDGCTTIAGAAGETYTLTSADVGSTLRVVVTATDAHGSASASSPQTSTVIATPLGPPAPLPPRSQVPPSIAGVLEVGETLVASLGAWSGDGPFEFRYQWLRCETTCDPIEGATARTYSVAPADVGEGLKVRVTAITPAGSVSADSETTAPVVAAPPTPDPAGSPAITPTPSPLPTPTAPAGAVGASTAPAGAVPVPPRIAGASDPATALMQPFPLVRIAGAFTRTRTRITLATVRAPRGSRIAVRCRGRGCPAPRRVLIARLSVLRFLQRSYSPGAMIEIRVTAPGVIGKYVKVSIRSGRPPARTDLCVRPEAVAPFRCPAG